jgi:aspartyl-tRNA(Asn)/glutamyl-tRNA(Gln) amidotransferase subunit C
MEMKINEVAELARIKLKPEEKERLSRDLENILQYVRKLNEIKTGEVPPTSHVLAIQDVFRPDEVKPQRIFEEALKHAPAREGAFYRVPKVIEGE